MFRRNMGNKDRLIRLSLASIFLVLYFTDTVTGIFGLVLLVLAIAFIGISIFAFCPFYPLLGINTCPVKKQKKQDDLTADPDSKL